MVNQLTLFPEVKSSKAWELAIIMKLKEYGLTLDSDWGDIVHALIGTVMPYSNIRIAERMRHERNAHRD